MPNPQKSHAQTGNAANCGLESTDASRLFKSSPINEPIRTGRFFGFSCSRAAENSADDPGILKDVADYYAASQQLKEAIPLYLRVLELQPDDANAREKLATGFVLTIS